MEIAVVLIGGAFTIAGAILGAWLAPRFQRLRTGEHREINPAAYELAYRGTLHRLAAEYQWQSRDKTRPKGEQNAKRKTLRSRERAGKAWVLIAGFQDKRSSRVAVNDAIDDVKIAVVSATEIDSEVRPDDNFLGTLVSERLQTRLGRRPVLQVIQTQEDAVVVARFFQEVFQRQMRRLTMGYSIGQWLGALILFAAAGVMATLAPSLWSGLNALSPDPISGDLLTSIKILYVAIVVGFVGGAISLFLLGR